MLTYTFDDTDDSNVTFFQKQERLLQTLEHRFRTYGYKKIEPPIFESYDLYTSVIGTIRPDDMVKVIAQSGQVLVMRPDATIPITQQIVAKYPNLKKDIRYFYVTNVYRQTSSEDTKEHTQAGVEYFGNSCPEADAEVLALAVHLMQDLRLQQFTVEIGHAGFTKELIDALNLPQDDWEQLKQLIQTKNMKGIRYFLSRFSLDSALFRALERIPLLYGDPFDVIEQAKQIAFNATLQAKLQELEQVLNLLQDYGVLEHVVIDLGLINHMGYYSDLIFQSFTGNVGKPIVMGGRYDKLSEQFGASIPAIGFACDTDALLESTQKQDKSYQPPIDIVIYYERHQQQAGLTAANNLREQGYRVLAYPEERHDNVHATYTVWFSAEGNTLQQMDQSHTFFDLAGLKQLLRGNQWKEEV